MRPLLPPQTDERAPRMQESALNTLEIQKFVLLAKSRSERQLLVAIAAVWLVRSAARSNRLGKCRSSRRRARSSRCSGWARAPRVARGVCTRPRSCRNGHRSYHPKLLHDSATLPRDGRRGYRVGRTPRRRCCRRRRRDRTVVAPAAAMAPGPMDGTGGATRRERFGLPTAGAPAAPRSAAADALPDPPRAEPSEHRAASHRRRAGRGLATHEQG